MAEFIPNLAFLAELGADPLFNAEMAKIGEAALAEAKMRVPVDTGALRDSLELVHLPGGGQRVQTASDHWIYPEYGTIYDAPEPYLRPSIDGLGLGR